MDSSTSNAASALAAIGAAPFAQNNPVASVTAPSNSNGTTSAADPTCAEQHHNPRDISPTPFAQNNVQPHAPAPMAAAAVLNLPPLEEATKRKCSVRGCRKYPLIQTLDTCAFEGCDKQVHFICYTNVVAKSKKIKEAHEELVFCTVDHQLKFDRETSVNNLTWTNDGRDGKNDPNTSEALLLSWLDCAENLNKYRSPTGGKRKIDVCNEIANYLNNNGVKVERNAKSVQNKIEWIQQMMRQTRDFIKSATGEGILANEGYESMRDKVSTASSFYLFYS